MQEGCLVEEVRDLRPLLVLLGGVEHPELGLLRQVLTDGVDGKHDLLHAAVITHDLEHTQYCCSTGTTVVLTHSTAVVLGPLQY